MRSWGFVTAIFVLALAPEVLSGADCRPSDSYSSGGSGCSGSIPQAPGTCTLTQTRTYSISWPDGHSQSIGASLTGRKSEEIWCCFLGSSTIVAYPNWSSPSSSTSGLWVLTGSDIQIDWQNKDCVWPCEDQLDAVAKTGDSHSWSTQHTCPSGCQDDSECGEDEWCQNGECGPIGGSPILVSLENNSFVLTGFADGVYFDFDADGILEKTGWTTSGSDDAFLTLDRNENGTIDDGTELFGNFSPQPPSMEPNGFVALASFDNAAYGGNEDGRISLEDAVFSSLQLWIDENHNGISEAHELFPITDSWINVINLDYRVSPRRDGHGNQFRYISEVYGDHDNGKGWAIDVIFALE